VGKGDGFWLVGDAHSSEVVLDEGILDKGNHFLNIMSKISHEYQLSILILLEIELVAAFL
jgi:hypothetical protein